MSSKSWIAKDVTIRGQHPELLGDVIDRLMLIPGYDPQALAETCINIHGVGGLGWHCARVLARKLVGHLRLFDFDEVEASNLNRCFYPRDVGRNKAEAAIDHLCPEILATTRLTAYPHRFESVAAAGIDVGCDLAIVAIDNDAGRTFAAEYYATTRTPCIFVAVDPHATSGYVFIQSSLPNQACWSCVVPDPQPPEVMQQCVGSEPGLLHTMAGIVSYAVDSLVMDRVRQWNYFEVFQDGLFHGGGTKTISVSDACAQHRVHYHTNGYAGN
ncbi:ThiF family adenylyltransferase [Chloroflexi bacterium TSY]|nr:ThiF family adenylyltransferase [Chloroflexi bacterium TSY]